MVVNNLSPRRQYPVSWGVPSWLSNLRKRNKSSPTGRNRPANAKEKDVEDNAIEASSKQSLEDGVDKTKSDSNCPEPEPEQNNDMYNFEVIGDSYSTASPDEFIDVDV